MVDFIQLLALGAIAGFTIFLGFPLIISKTIGNITRGFLNALAAGILVFLLIEIISDTWEIAVDDLKSAFEGNVSMFIPLEDLTILFLGLAIGLIGLAYYESRYMNPNQSETNLRSRLATMIALGIGVHNLSEGLAIGQSYASGAISLALLLIVGFGAHNATEGFGILAPLTGMKEKINYAFILGILTLGGAPTFLGTIIGSMYFSTLTYIFFLSIAGGALIYVILILYNVGRRQISGHLFMSGIFLGFLVSALTDLLITISGV